MRSDIFLTILLLQLYTSSGDEAFLSQSGETQTSLTELVEYSPYQWNIDTKQVYYNIRDTDPKDKTSWKNQATVPEYSLACGIKVDYSGDLRYMELIWCKTDLWDLQGTLKLGRDDWDMSNQVFKCPEYRFMDYIQIYLLNEKIVGLRIGCSRLADNKTTSIDVLIPKVINYKTFTIMGSNSQYICGLQPKAYYEEYYDYYSSIAVKMCKVSPNPDFPRGL